MRSKGLPLATSALLLALLPGAAFSQAVHGRVLDAATEEPIPGATVVLVGPRGFPTGAATATTEGRFEITTDGSGLHRLTVQRIGYPTTTSREFTLRPGEVVEITFRLDAQAILLAPITVEARAGGVLGRDQLARRCAPSRDVTCMDPVQVASIEGAIFPSQLFRNVRGVMADAMVGGTVRRLGGGCLVTFLNNDPDPIMAHIPRTLGSVGVISETNPRRGRRFLAVMGADPSFFDNALDKRVPEEAVRAIEVYPDFEDVPAEIRDGPRGRHLWPDWRSGHLGHCGVVIVWTWDQW